MIPSPDRPTFRQMLAGVVPRRIDLLWLTLVGTCALALSVVFNRFGLVHFEWWYYIPFHLEPGSVWAKIFNSRSLDQGIYAGRELSYLIDHIDIVAMAASVEWGHPVFVSLTHLVLSVFMGVWLGWFAAKDLKLGSLIGLLLALLLWTSPYVYVHFLMRTAKGLTAAGALVLAVEIVRACRAEAANPAGALTRGRAWLIALAATVMSFADRQGFYFLLCAGLFTGLQWIWSRSRVARQISFVLGGVLVVELVYFFWLAPALTQAFWNYSPDFSFNRLPVEELAANPVQFCRDASFALLESTRFTLGQIPAWQAGVVLASLVAVPLVREWRERSWRRQLPVSLVIAAMIGALWVMNALMVLRHPRILWADMMTVYYWIPAAVLVVLGLACSWGDWVASRPWRRITLAALLLVLVGGNIDALPRHRSVFESGHLQESVATSEEMRYALTHRGAPTYRAPQSIAYIPAYLTLLELAPQWHGAEPPWDEFYFGGLYQATRATGAAPRFIEQFGGNVDSRFLSTTGRFETAAGGGRFVGDSAAHTQMRLNLVSNRLRGEVIVQRTGPDTSAPLAAEFVISASPYDTLRFERWRQRVELPAGQAAVTVPYEIDSSHLATLFTVELPAESVGQVAAGWFMPTITDVGGDSAAPVWFSRSSSPVTILDEAALAKLLPGAWRPVEARMRQGRVTDAGIELQPGGEIWLKANYIVSRLAGGAVVTGDTPGKPATVRALWYKAGRLQGYEPPGPPDEKARTQSFQAWCAEPGGWLVIAADPTPGLLPVIVRVSDVKQE